MRSEEILPEIYRIPQSHFTGGKSSLRRSQANISPLPLPGGSGLQYHISNSGQTKAIYIFDPKVKDPIGLLNIREREFPLRPAYEVVQITVDEDYRGQGIAKALYGIVLAVMKAVLLAGDSQTPGGRRNWSSLYQIPGAEVRAYVRLYEDSETLVTTKLFANSGAKKLGKVGKKVYYSMPVRMRPGSPELRLFSNQLKLYIREESFSLNIGLYAKFGGSTE